MKLFSLAVVAAAALLTGCATSPASDATNPIDFARYHAVNIAPIQFAPEVSKAIPAAELASLQKDLRGALNEGLTPAMLAEKPSLGVLRMELTVTELNASNPAVNVLTTTLLWLPMDAGGVAFEARFYDGESGEPIAQTTYRHMSKPMELRGSFERYGHATEALRDWAEGLTRGIGSD
jgi:hypothetical protein